MSPPHQLEAPKDNAGVLVFPPLLLALCAAAGAFTWWVTPRVTIPASISFVAAGLCVAAGLLLDRWAQGTLRSANTAVHPSEATSSIVRSGAFAFSRNPIYLAQGLLLAAVGFLLRSAVYFWVLVPWFVVMRFGVIAREERYLLQKFGQPYAQYMNAVRRWL